jgi:hypothetical protein
LLWRASLLSRACGGLSATGGSRLLGALAPFPGVAPRLLRAHVDTALTLLGGLQSRSGAVGELQGAAERLAGAAGEAAAAAAGSGGGAASAGAAGLLAALRQAVAGATGARLQMCLAAGAVRAALLEGGAEGWGEGEGEGEGGGGGGEALTAASSQLAALAREWEAEALLRALSARRGAGGLRALEGAVWAATGGARSLRAAVDV